MGENNCGTKEPIRRIKIS